MKIVGITGGIGSGKSVVSRILRLNGAKVYDCDTEARSIMESDPCVVRELTAILGASAYKEGGGLDRRYVAEKIFTDEVLRSLVNGVVHKAVREDFLHKASSWGDLSFCESAILATSHFDKICDEIWYVTAPEDERIIRVMKRDSLSEEEIRKRIDTQRKEFDCLPKEKVIEIRNGDNDLLLPCIYKLIEIINSESICLEKF